MDDKSYITAKDIYKSYGETKALNGVSFNVNKNEIFGFLGPDGSGKTTLFRIMITLLLADKGTAHMGPWDIRKDYKTIRRSIGYMPGRFSLYQDLSVEENLILETHVSKEFQRIGLRKFQNIHRFSDEQIRAVVEYILDESR